MRGRNAVTAILDFTIRVSLLLPPLFSLPSSLSPLRLFLFYSLRQHYENSADGVLTRWNPCYSSRMYGSKSFWGYGTAASAGGMPAMAATMIKTEPLKMWARCCSEWHHQLLFDLTKQAESNQTVQKYIYTKSVIKHIQRHSG